MVESVFAIPRRSANGAKRRTDSSGHSFASRHDAAVPLPHFIAGPENGLTKLAADSVTDQWVRFNPLLISGPSGVGKTHLLHCLLELSQQTYPDLHSMTITGADYARAIAHGIEVNSLADVRDGHRSVDLLILDGLQELVTKPLAQQELLHTIDHLVENEGQVIVTSRTELHELASLMPALASRIEGGLHIPIVPPAASTRRSILDELAQQQDVIIPPIVSQRLATDSNRRSSKPLLFSDLTAAIAALRFAAGQADVHATNEAIDQIISRTELNHDVDAKEISRRAARYFNVTVRELTSNSRRKTVVRARALSVYLMRSILGTSFQGIGQELGGRDHSTVMHAFQRANEWMESDSGFARAMTEVRKQLD